MSKLRWGGWMLAVLLCTARASGQVTTIDSLHEVGVVGARKAPADARASIFSPGLRTSVLDSAVLRLYAQQSLGTLLAEQSSVFVKSYGFNALATLNFRGASAAQSLVLWNGVPLQNAALGLADVSLVPVSLMDKVSVLYGASAGLWGSGAVGGAVLIESEAAQYGERRRRVDASVSAGSFGQQSAVLRGDVSGKKLALSVRAFGQRAENDFWVQATLFSPGENQQNAVLRAGGFLARGGLKISTRETLEAHAWVQQYDRQIPRATFETASVKAQTDRNLRALLRYKRTGRTELGAKLAGLFDGLDYDDAASGQFSANRSRQLYGEASARRRFGKEAEHQVILFAPVHLSQMERSDGAVVSQQRIAFAGAAKAGFLQSKLEAAASARLEAIDGKVFFLPGINASYQLLPQFSIRTAVQRTYRAPTLSELYYNPGGNEGLKPEEGWGGEGGYSLAISHGNGLSFRQEATAYTRHIRNWILWFGGTIWTPHNIAAVRSEGLELDNRLAVPLSQNSQFVVSLNGAVMRARTLESMLPTDGSIGKQIPYTPRMLGHGSVGLYVRKFFLAYQHTYTGIRYVTTDESFGLPAYHTGNVNGMWEGGIRKHSAALSLRLANLWNAEYAVVAGRPMPRRHFLITARFGVL